MSNFRLFFFFLPGFVSIFACGLLFNQETLPCIFFSLICSSFARKNVCKTLLCRSWEGGYFCCKRNKTTQSSNIQTRIIFRVVLPKPQCVKQLRQKQTRWHQNCRFCIWLLQSNTIELNSSYRNIYKVHSFCIIQAISASVCAVSLLAFRYYFPTSVLPWNWKAIGCQSF